MKAFICFCTIFINLSINAQHLTLFDINADDFPTMYAKFYAFDNYGNQILNLSSNDFELTENGILRNITNISCPLPKLPVAISSVLVMDASGSMFGKSLEMAKDAAKAWIESIPLGKAECAISSFNDYNYLIQDFTNVQSLLLNGINALYARGGTNYNAALIEPNAGGLHISKTGKYQKVIVMLTDGIAPQPDINKIVEEANKQNCSIYVITLEMSCPQSLKIIAEQTGGMWFEKVSSSQEIQDIYKKIAYFVQNVNPCSLEWESEELCEQKTINIELKHKTLNLNTQNKFIPSLDIISKLEFEPYWVNFENPIPGIKIEKSITVTAKNTDINVIDITCTNVSYEINPKKFNLKKGQSKELTLSYLPIDSGYTQGRFEIETTQCSYKYFASGGWFGIKPKTKTLKIIQPNGGENFIVGMDTVITWEGVLPNEPVNIEYTTNNGVDWHIIKEKATGLSYNWKIPNTPSEQCLARVTSIIVYPDYDDEMVLIPAGYFIMGNNGKAGYFPEEAPTHKVTISRDFFIGRYEISQKKYFAVMGENPSFHIGEDLPVELVSWYDAIEFCNKLSDLRGLERCYTINGFDVECNWDASGYRLPTEAEWEYACKATNSYDFYIGSIQNYSCIPLDGNLDRIGWYCGNSEMKTNIIGQKFSNNYGLFDMSGNVSEWCWDWYETYTNIDKIDPKGPISGTERVIRGGAWNSIASNCRSSFRYYLLPVVKSNNNGFRIVRNLIN